MKRLRQVDGSEDKQGENVNKKAKSSNVAQSDGLKHDNGSNKSLVSGAAVTSSRRSQNIVPNNKQSAPNGKPTRGPTVSGTENQRLQDSGSHPSHHQWKAVGRSTPGTVNGKSLPSSAIVSADKPKLGFQGFSLNKPSPPEKGTDISWKKTGTTPPSKNLPPLKPPLQSSAFVGPLKKSYSKLAHPEKLPSKLVLPSTVADAVDEQKRLRQALLQPTPSRVSQVASWNTPANSTSNNDMNASASSSGSLVPPQKSSSLLAAGTASLPAEKLTKNQRRKRNKAKAAEAAAMESASVVPSHEKQNNLKECGQLVRPVVRSNNMFPKLPAASKNKAARVTTVTSTPAAAAAAVSPAVVIQDQAADLSAEEDMEVEYCQVQRLIDGLRDQMATRTSSPLTTEMQLIQHSVTQNSSSDNLSVLPQTEQLFVVVDTNVFIDDVKFLDSVVNGNATRFENVTVVIPWLVLQELDGLKDARYGNPERMILKSKAVTAVSCISKLLEAKHRHVVGQTPAQSAEVLPGFKVERPDDRLLQCCVQFSNKFGINSVVLLSNDRNLRNKAMVMDIKCFTRNDFANWLFSKNVSLKHFSKISCSSQPVIDLTGTSSPVRQNAPTCSRTSQCSKTAVVGSGTPSASSNATSGQTPTRRYIPSTAATTNGSKSTATSTLSQHKKPSPTGDEQVTHIMSQMKLCLVSGLSHLLKSEMTSIYGELWLQIIFRKPPWTLVDILDSFHKHFLAVFGQVWPRSFADDIKSLRDCAASPHYTKSTAQRFIDIVTRVCSTINDSVESEGNVRNYKHVKTNLISNIEHYNDELNNRQRPADLLTTTTATTITTTTTTSESAASLLSSSTSSNHVMDDIQQSVEGQCVADTSSQFPDNYSTSQCTVPSTVDSDSCLNPMSVGDGPNTIQSRHILQCFQSIGETILSLRDGYAGALSTVVENRDEVLRTFVLFCQTVSQFHSTFCNALNANVATNVASFIDFTAAVNRFIELSQLQFAPITCVQLRILFSTEDRQLLANGLQQIEEMMKSISLTCEQFLLPVEIELIRAHCS